MNIGEPMSYPTTVKLNRDGYQEVTTRSIVFALSHFCFESDSSLKSLILLSQFYLKFYDTVHIVTAQSDEGEFVSLVDLFELIPSPQAGVYVDSVGGLRISCLTESKVIECFAQQDETPVALEAEEGSTLVLFHDEAFGVGTIDLLAKEMDAVLLLAHPLVSELMESYQILKSLVQVKANIQSSVLLLNSQKEDDSVKLMEGELQQIIYKFLNAKTKMVCLYPETILENDDSESVVVGPCYGAMDESQMTLPLSQNSARKNQLYLSLCQ